MVTEVKRTPLIVIKDRWVPDDLQAKLKTYRPKSELGKIAKACFAYLPADLAGELLDRISSSLVIESTLSLVHIRFDQRLGLWAHDDYGVVSHRVITTAGVNYLVDTFQGTGEPETVKYHGLGTGTTAADVSDTALVTELTTEYTGNVRATGSTTEGASANIYRTVGTNTLDSGTPAVTEHGVFSADSAGTLWDRHVFSAVNLDGTAGDSLASTYDATLSSGG